MPVQERLRIDRDRLAAYLRDYIPDFPASITLEQFKGGQSNPTYLITAGERRFVMRRKPPGNLSAVRTCGRSGISRHDRPRRHRRAGAAHVVLVRRRIDHRHGILRYGLRSGPRLLGPCLTRHHAHGAQRNLGRDQSRHRGAAHSRFTVPWASKPYGRSSGYIQRQIDRWSKLVPQFETERIEAMDNLIDWLPKNIPARRRDHHRPRTISASTTSSFIRPSRACSPCSTGELSTLGHPLADFALPPHAWRLGPGQFRGMNGVDFTPSAFRPKRNTRRAIANARGGRT
jgi:aminoglycoside phosphotransferase (APT) family kinase protein